MAKSTKNKTAGKAAPKTAKKKRMTIKPKTALKQINPVLAEIGRELGADNKASMFGGDGQGMKSRLVQLDEAAPGDLLRSYYKNMVLHCVKCDGSFSHKADLPLMEYQIKCPHCAEAHVLKFKPASRLFTVQSDSVDVLDSKD
jgi:hypothetical protein